MKSVIATLGLCALGLVAWSAREVPAPRVVLGDGTRGPTGMAWVPGGVFVMGSNHVFAQANERPAHRVKVR